MMLIETSMRRLARISSQVPKPRRIAFKYINFSLKNDIVLSTSLCSMFEHICCLKKKKKKKFGKQHQKIH